MILVTGGTGLLGSHLLFDLVSAGKKPRAIKRTESDLSFIKKIFRLYAPTQVDLFENIEWVEGDVLDVYSLAEAMEGVTQVYHCAAMVSYDPRDSKQMLKINKDGTANVMNMALETGVKKVAHVSSIAALGRNDSKEFTTEKNPWKNSPFNSNYSISKYSAEQEAWRAAEEGLEIVVINPSVIIGPGNWEKSSALMFSTAFRGLKYYAMGGTGFVDVKDVSKCLIHLMESPVKNERFIVSAENRTYKDFFDQVHDAFSRKRPSIKAGWFLSNLAWRLEKVRSLITGTNSLITKETVEAAHTLQEFSNQKILRAMGIEFIPVSQSIKETCTLFLSDHKGV